MACLALRKRKGGLWAWLIRRWTRSDYDHCELVVGQCWYSSLLWSGGVRRLDSQPPGEWDFVSIPWANDDEIESYFYATDAYGYDWLAILGQVVRGRWQLKQSAMCSEWCAAAIGLPQPWAYDPGMLGETVERITEVWGDK